MSTATERGVRVGLGPYIFFAVAGLNLAAFLWLLWRPSRGLWWGLLALAGAGLLWAWFIAYVGAAESPGYAGSRAFILLAALGAIGVVLMVIGARRRIACLRGHGPGRCAACGYDLAGFDGGVCPECGRALKT